MTQSLCTVPLRSWPEAGGCQNHSGCLCGAEGPEQRPVSSLAGDLPATTYKTVQDADLSCQYLEKMLLCYGEIHTTLKNSYVLSNWFNKKVKSLTA